VEEPSSVAWLRHRSRGQNRHSYWTLLYNNCWALAVPEQNISTCQDDARWQNFVRWWWNCYQHIGNYGVV